jgi:NosR/NirI family transcriptional regulator, nitrous oxide reductase regulator
VVLSLFVGRPYCRFLFPYGVILRQLSRLSHWHLSITPKDCINCRLCEDACPYGAIQGPTADPGNTDAAGSPGARRRLALLLLLVPLCVAAAGWAGGRVAPHFVKLHPAGRNLLRMQAAGQALDTPEAGEQLKVARRVEGQLHWGGWIAGGFIGLVVGVRLVKLSIYRKRTQYDPERGACVSCARCLTSCPKEPANRLPQDVLVPLQVMTGIAPASGRNPT